MIQLPPGCRVAYHIWIDVDVLTDSMCYRQDGTGSVKINFHGDDASTASVFILKFGEYVVAHNMKTEFELIK